MPDTRVEQCDVEAVNHAVGVDVAPQYGVAAQRRRAGRWLPASLVALLEGLGQRDRLRLSERPPGEPGSAR